MARRVVLERLSEGQSFGLGVGAWPTRALLSITSLRRDLLGRLCRLGRTGVGSACPASLTIGPTVRGSSLIAFRILRLRLRQGGGALAPCVPRS